LSLGLACAIAYASVPWLELGRSHDSGSLYPTEGQERDLTIKWPNDVVYRGRKLSGVLAESRAAASGERPAVVLGAGLNVNYREEDFPEEIRERATSLAIGSGRARLPMGPILNSILFSFAVR